MIGPRPALLLAGALALGGCSERMIAVANDQVLVTVEAVKRTGSLAEAEVHYVLASPTPLAEGESDLVARMTYEAGFDCAHKTWSQRAQDVELVGGRIIHQTFDQADSEVPSAGSVSESVVRSVCDPEFAASHATRRARVSIEKDYLRRTGAAAN